MGKTHRVRGDQLEREMRARPHPIIKLSIRLLDMKSSEKNLVRQKAFEDAWSMRKRVDKLEYAEVDAFDRKCEAAQNRRRRLLEEENAYERKKRMQISKKMEFHVSRATSKDMKLTADTLDHMASDMKHFHTMDRKKQPQFNLRPVVPNRASYDT